MSTKTVWSPEDYERAMSYKGRRSAAVVQRITGIPATTVRGWWRGIQPKFMYTEAQKAGQYPKPPGTPPLPPDERRRRMLETKRLNNKKNWRKYYHRYKGIYHPVFNPDPGLIPLHQLWLPGLAVLEFIRSRWTHEQVMEVLEPARNGGEYRRYYELTRGKEWIRYDAADALFVKLGLVLSEMDVEPLHCTVPRNLPREVAA